MPNRNLLFAAVGAICHVATAAPGDYFRIHVVDRDTSRGVPLIQVTAPAGLQHFTDSAGMVAFHEPAYMGQQVHFTVEGHGYEYPPDAFGSRGRSLKVEAGSSATLVVNRVNIAQRLYRITGAGIYHDSVLLGDTPPIEKPLLNARVTGQDSVMTAVYKGRYFWLWGDTGNPGHPLTGNFMTTCAWSDLPGKGGLDPDVGVNLNYITRGSFTKPMAKFPERAMYWLHSLLVVPDADGREHMLAGYNKVKAPMETVERGWMEFADEEEVFKPFRKDDMKSPMLADGHVNRVTEAGTDYFYFSSGTQLFRTTATLEHVRRGDVDAWTCLTTGTAEDATTSTIGRDEQGRLRYAWRSNAAPVGYNEQDKLTSNGLIRRDEKWFAFRDIETGKSIRPHGLCVRWNPYRQRWTMVFTEIFGSSMLGEIWYAEADSPVGPWAHAVKIMTHKKYSFYNPYIHGAFTKDGGRTVYFEGTYTMMFSGNEIPTPRYDYNQVMYKLEMDDPRLALPVLFYRRAADGGIHYSPRAKEETSSSVLGEIAFFAYDRATTQTVAIAAETVEGSTRLREARPGEAVVFHALPVVTQFPGLPVRHGTVPLYEFRRENEYRYETNQAKVPSDFVRSISPLCYVWENPATNVRVKVRAPH